MTFLESLAKKGLIKSAQIEELRAFAEEKFNGDVEMALVESGINEDDILSAKGEFYNIPSKKINVKEIAFDILKYIPEDSASHYHFVPFGLSEGVLQVGITDPENIQGIDALQFISAKIGMPFKIFLISRKDYEEVMQAYKSVSVDIEEALKDINEDEEENLDLRNVNEDNLNKEIAEAGSGKETKIVEDAPVIKIVAVILKNAVDGEASDIHIEHMGGKVRVRYRVDGSLYTSLMLPKNVHTGIIARIKVLSKLHLDEKRKPQDGSFSATIDGRKIDFRVSTMPGYYGEKAAIRILDTKKGVKTLEQLGLSKRNEELMREAIAKPYGLILITGPTGSGKSTTLYSIMNELDREKHNVVSLEDPIEYHMAEVNQSQVLPEIGYTFASGLRSILRQDPDIIMVGEIRDKETAQLAIQAALTGHMVFSTLHTNSAIGAIPRLVDMGVDPYLIAPTLILAVAQRLSTVACESSKKKVAMDESVQMQVAKQFEDLSDEFKKELNLVRKEMYDIVPSPECPSGTKGRVAIFEMFSVDKEVQDVILKNPVDSALYEVVRKKGMLTMREDAMLKALDGVIPFREVYNFTSLND